MIVGKVRGGLVALLAVGALGLAGCGSDSGSADASASAGGVTAAGQTPGAPASDSGATPGAAATPGGAGETATPGGSGGGSGGGAAGGGAAATEAPEAPRDVKAQGEVGTLAVSWSPPSGGAAVVEYRAFAFDAGNEPVAQCSVNAPATVCVMPDLPAGEYTAKVRAVNEAGAGPESKASAAAEVK